MEKIKVKEFNELMKEDFQTVTIDGKEFQVKTFIGYAEKLQIAKSIAEVCFSQDLGVADTNSIHLLMVTEIVRHYVSNVNLPQMEGSTDYEKVYNIAMFSGLYEGVLDVAEKDTKVLSNIVANEIEVRSEIYKNQNSVRAIVEMVLDKFSSPEMINLVEKVKEAEVITKKQGDIVDTVD